MIGRKLYSRSMRCGLCPENPISSLAGLSLNCSSSPCHAKLKQALSFRPKLRANFQRIRPPIDTHPRGHQRTLHASRGAQGHEVQHSAAKQLKKVYGQFLLRGSAVLSRCSCSNYEILASSCCAHLPVRAPDYPVKRSIVEPNGQVLPGFPNEF